MTRRHVLAFDSGVGGLGIVRALRAAIPGVAVTYLADTGFFPYGDKGDAELVERIVALLRAVVRRRAPDLVVIACNTASTIALPALRAALDLPIVGTVPPIKWAASVSRTRTIGLLATAATVRRPYLADLQARFAPDCRLLAHPAPDLVALAERHFGGAPAPDDAVAAEVAPLLADGTVDSICLGCTHFGLVLPQLRRAAPPGMLWLDPAEPVARRAAELLGDASGGSAAEDLALVTAPASEPFLSGLRNDGFAKVERMQGAALHRLGPRAPDPFTNGVRGPAPGGVQGRSPCPS